MIGLPFHEFIERLRTRLVEPLPGEEVQLTMAPSSRPMISMEAAAGICREAAVLVLLYPVANEPTLLLTVRPENLPHHSGQIAFPGGRREGKEQLSQTALREAHEEVGITPSEVDLIGTLTPLYVPPSNYCVYPFVGAAATTPRIVPADAEVADVIQVSLATLLAPPTRRVETQTVLEETIIIPCFMIGDYRIWGATAMILAELLGCARDL